MPSWLAAIVDYSRSEWRTIMGAPGIFITGCLIVGVATWSALSWRYSAQIENRDAIIGSRDATIKYQETELTDYRSKLHVGSPDEAARRIDELEKKLSAKIAGMTPRSLSSEQKKILRECLSLSGTGDLSCSHYI
jgi:hypothetical protein